MNEVELRKKIGRFLPLFVFLLSAAGFAYLTHLYLPAGYAQAAGENGDWQGAMVESSGEEEFLEVALTYLRENRAALGLTEADLADLVLKDQYTSQHNGVTHIYLRQRLNGIEIFNADINVNISRDGQVINVNNGFVPNLAQGLRLSRNRQATISAKEAVAYAAEALELTITEPLEARQSLKARQRRGGDTDELLLSDGGISQQDIPAKLVYQPLSPQNRGEGSPLRLAWDIEIDETTGENYWSIRVDALNGEVLDQINWVIHDEWGHAATERSQADGQTEPYPAPEAPYPAPEAPYPAPLPEQYRVFAMPIESPNHGSRSLVSDPSNKIASPFGWHDTDGMVGAEYTTTRGNNVYVYEDGNHVGYSPDGGESLTFDFPLDLTQAPDAYEDAAITNLFYWSNLIHDVSYQYGFDEVSGNFQQNNYDKGGEEGDSLLAQAQDGAGLNNATFSAPPDGRSPYMQMYLWNQADPSLDGSLDNSIILHEYGHGISTRLTGGPSNAGCLNPWLVREQGGEGWSDWFALALTAKMGDKGSDTRGIGTYVLNQPPTGGGIRPAPYSTEMSINHYTYGDIADMRVPHGVGFVWGTMLWEMYWKLVDAHGFDPDLYHGTGGNNLALQLVIDGLKLQPCFPGFVDARDAILLADEVNNKGANQCLLWDAFAKRGLGVSADQGYSYINTDGQEAFDVPPDCATRSHEIPLSAGWNLISLPLEPTPRSRVNPAQLWEGSQSETEISYLLRSITGNYEQVYAYDGCNQSEPWQKFDPNAPPFANTLNNADETMGLWINMSVSDTLVITGTMPLTSTISSCSGWNLIGYPSVKESAITDTLDSIEGRYTLVNGYQASDTTAPWQKFDANAPPFANTLNQMQPGKGYWIQMDQDVQWMIKNP